MLKESSNAFFVIICERQIFFMHNIILHRLFFIYNNVVDSVANIENLIMYFVKMYIQVDVLNEIVM